MTRKTAIRVARVRNPALVAAMAAGVLLLAGATLAFAGTPSGGVQSPADAKTVAPTPPVNM